MDAWQAKQQLSTTAIFLPSKRMQTIQEESLLIAFSHQESPHAEIPGDTKKGKETNLSLPHCSFSAPTHDSSGEMELWVGAEKER